MGTFSHKKEPMMNSEPVSVDKRGARDEVLASYLGEDEYAKKKLDSAAKNFEKYTLAFKSGGPKPKARGRKWSTQTIHIMQMIIFYEGCCRSCRIFTRTSNCRGCI